MFVLLIFERNLFSIEILQTTSSEILSNLTSMNTSFIENPIFFLSKHHNFDESEENMKTLKIEREKISGGI